MNLSWRNHIIGCVLLTAVVVFCDYKFNSYRTVQPIPSPRSRVLNLVVKVLTYEQLAGRLPTTEEGLEILSKKPAGISPELKWDMFEGIGLLDRWGRSHVYVEDANLEYGFGIYSLGADGRTASNGNDRDDVNSWSETPWKLDDTEISKRGFDWRKLIPNTFLLATLLYLTIPLRLICKLNKQAE